MTDRDSLAFTEADCIDVDLFAGGGGASIGTEAALGSPVTVAINHDEVAIAVHLANHPRTEHWTSDVWEVEPAVAVRGRRVRHLHASPDCKDFSRAKGGKPKSQKIRSLAWVITAWIARVMGTDGKPGPDVLTVENVAEFEEWGPLHGEGTVIDGVDVSHTRIESRKGETFRRWCRQIESFGYKIEHRVMHAHHYGAPTSRKRFFLVARRDKKPIVWPTATHGPGLLPYRTVAECIDWSIPCPSIFTRKRPLAEKTLARIAAGIRRFVIDSANPFIIPVNHGGGESRCESIDAPLSTVTAARRGHALVTPFIAGCGGRAGQTPPTSGDAPIGTITAKNDRILVAPSLIQTGYGERKGQAPRVLDLHKPLGAVMAQGQKHALVSAFLAKHYGGVVGHGLERPIGAVTAVDHHSLVTGHLEVMRNNAHGKGLDEPAPTVTASGNHLAEVRAFLTTYYGSTKDVGQSMRDPCRTVVTKDRFGLVTVQGVDYAISDIGMRMLEPHELLRCQFGRFAQGYDMTAAKTKKDQVRLIGNSVCPELQEAIVAAQFPEEAARARARAA